ncbi:MAG: MFS transporter [Myxococcota bacterium]|nr:MFS transporter [Myxococcota bacterium]
MGLLRDRRFAPFFWTQFLGAFTDNAFKQALILMITFRAAMGEAETGVLIAVASGLFILPYFLFSPLAGQLSDKYDKATLMRWVKVLEIVIMCLAAAGFVFASFGISWAEYYLIGILFLMGTQSTFFGPAKYSIIPQHLRNDELMEGTALVEMGTFVAILTGTIVGGVLILQSEFFVGGSLIALATAGWLASRGIPAAAPSNPDEPIRWNWLSSYGQLYRVSKQKNSVLLAILGISWFWFLGAMVMAQLPNYVKLFIRGDEPVYIFFLSLFTISIALGSTLTNRLTNATVELGMVPVGAVGLSIFPLDIGWLDYSVLPEATLSLTSLMTLQADPLIYRVVFDVFAMGIASSFFIVPLYALLQHRTESKTRSQVIAANNVAGAMYMVVSAGVVSALYSIGFDTAELFLFLALFNALNTIYLIIVHPEFLLRMGSWLVGSMRYRVRYHGRHNIPREGACVVVANRVGWLDWPVITTACERPVRFVTRHTNVEANRRMVVARWLGAIVPRSEDEPASEIEAALERGEVVCLFENADELPNLDLDALLERAEVRGVPIALHGFASSTTLETPTGWIRRSVTVTIGEAEPTPNASDELADAPPRLHASA